MPSIVLSVPTNSFSSHEAGDYYGAVARVVLTVPHANKLSDIRKLLAPTRVTFRG